MSWRQHAALSTAGSVSPALTWESAEHQWGPSPKGKTEKKETFVETHLLLLMQNVDSDLGNFFF